MLNTYNVYQKKLYIKKNIHTLINYRYFYIKIVSLPVFKIEIRTKLQKIAISPERCVQSKIRIFRVSKRTGHSVPMHMAYNQGSENTLTHTQCVFEKQHTEKFFFKYICVFENFLFWKTHSWLCVIFFDFVVPIHV